MSLLGWILLASLAVNVLAAVACARWGRWMAVKLEGHEQP